MKYSRRRHSVLSLMLKRTLYCPVIQSVPVFASAFHNKIVKQTRHRENAGFSRFRSSWHVFNLHSVFILEPRIIGFLRFDITPVFRRMTQSWRIQFKSRRDCSSTFCFAFVVTAILKNCGECHCPSQKSRI